MTWRLDGFDKAHYQDEGGAPINWDVARGSMNWCAAKMTQRDNYVDPFFDDSRTQMARVQFRTRLFYHWLSPTSEASIARQVQRISKTSGGFQTGEGFMLDAEQTGITEPDAWEILNEVEHGITRRPSSAYFGMFTAGGELARSRRIWFSDYGPRAIIIAAYTTQARLAYLLNLHGLNDLPIAANQFSSNGPVPGVNAARSIRCDMDQVNDWDVFDLCCGLTSIPQPVPQPVPNEGDYEDMDVVTNANDWDPEPSGQLRLKGYVKFAVNYRGQALYHLLPTEWKAGGSKPGVLMSNEEIDELAAIPMPATSAAAPAIDLDALATAVAAKIVVPPAPLPGALRVVTTSTVTPA